VAISAFIAVVNKYELAEKLHIKDLIKVEQKD
jgi:hypothetical protein